MISMLSLQKNPLRQTRAMHVNYMVDKGNFCMISGNGEENSGSDMETEQGKVNQEWLCASNFVYNFDTPGKQS